MQCSCGCEISPNYLSEFQPTTRIILQINDRIGPEISSSYGVEVGQCGQDCSKDKSCYAFQYRALDKWCVNLKYPKSVRSLKKTQVNDIKVGGQIQDVNCPGLQYCIKTAAAATETTAAAVTEH